MGLFDSLKDQVMNQAGSALGLGGQGDQTLGIFVQALDKMGGIQGLITRFQSQGLGHIGSAAPDSSAMDFVRYLRSCRFGDYDLKVSVSSSLLEELFNGPGMAQCQDDLPIRQEVTFIGKRYTYAG